MQWAAGTGVHCPGRFANRTAGRPFAEVVGAGAPVALTTFANRHSTDDYSRLASRQGLTYSIAVGTRLGVSIGRPRPRRRRLRSRRRRRSADDDEQRSRRAVPQRPEDRQPQSQAAPDRHHLESRRDQRHRPHLPRRHVTVADGEKRVELSVQSELPFTFASASATASNASSSPGRTGGPRIQRRGDRQGIDSIEGKGMPEMR